MRHLGKVSFALVFLVSACNMYGEKAPRMKNPVPIKKTVTEDPPPVIVDIPDCEFQERDMPIPKPAPAKTAEHERAGDAKAQVLTTAADPTVKKEAMIDLVDAYGRALASDPFNPDLTLKLALAYDKAQRKGCALRLLGRLAKLSDNPKYAKKATPVIDEVLDRKTYFERYRKDAVRAVGR